MTKLDPARKENDILNPNMNTDIIDEIMIEMDVENP